MLSKTVLRPVFPYMYVWSPQKEAHSAMDQHADAQAPSTLLYSTCGSCAFGLGLTAANTFATADECAYNANLSAHWADAVAAQAIESRMLPPPVQLSDIQEDDTMVRPYLNRAAAGLQPRGNRLPPLLTDFFVHETVSLETQPWLRELYPGKRLPSNEQFPLVPASFPFRMMIPGVMMLWVRRLQLVFRWTLCRICNKLAMQNIHQGDVWLLTTLLSMHETLPKSACS